MGNENRLPRHPDAVRPGGSQRALALTGEMRAWPKIDLNDLKQIEERIDQYFNLLASYDSKGTVSGLAFALGIDRIMLYEITRGLVTAHKCTHIAQENKAKITEAYKLLEVMWEENFVAGNINPVTGIFLGKNHYGYRDQTEVVVEPKNALGETEDKEELEKRLLASVVIDKK